MFKDEDIVEGSTKLHNTGIPLQCPLCNQRSIRVWLPTYLMTRLYICRSCGFYGDVVRLFAKKENIKFSEAYCNYYNKNRFLQQCPAVWETQETIQQILNQNYTKDKDQIESYLKSKGLSNSLTSVPNILDNFHFLLSDDIEELQHLLKGSYIPDSAIVFPLYLRKPVITSLWFLGEGKDDALVTLKSCVPGPPETGIWIEDEDQLDSVILLPNVIDLINLTRTFKLVSPHKPSPFGLWDPHGRNFDLSLLGCKKIIPVNTINVNHVSSSTINLDNLYFTTYGLKDLQTLTNQYGHGLCKELDLTYVPSNTFFNLVGPEDQARLTNLSQEYVKPDELSQLIDNSKDRLEVIKAFRGAEDAKHTAIQGTRYYMVKDDGSVIRLTRKETPPVVHMANSFFRVKKAITLDDDIIYEGELLYDKGKTKDISVKLPDVCWLTNLTRECLKDGIQLNLYSTRGSHWLNICLDLSQPKIMTMYTTPTYTNNRLYLPNRVISEDGIEEVNYIKGVRDKTIFSDSQYSNNIFLKTSDKNERKIIRDNILLTCLLDLQACMDKDSTLVLNQSYKSDIDNYYTNPNIVWYKDREEGVLKCVWEENSYILSVEEKLDRRYDAVSRKFADCLGKRLLKLFEEGDTNLVPNWDKILIQEMNFVLRHQLPTLSFKPFSGEDIVRCGELTIKEKTALTVALSFKTETKIDVEQKNGLLLVDKIGLNRFLRKTMDSSTTDLQLVNYVKTYGRSFVIPLENFKKVSDHHLETFLTCD